ncbi:MAG: hypothetical protein Q7I95_05270 [Thiobacillus sp.]|nr:hypothetical protein [Thiobacillus sp.]MDP3123472.1 hypothetical protein [Thiobacillus sp.]
MTQDELKSGFFYSNGAYGRTWGVRQLAEITTDAENGELEAYFKGVAGTCRRKKGHCSLTDFARWAKYQVALVENDWKRVGGDAPSAESEAA